MHEENSICVLSRSDIDHIKKNQLLGYDIRSERGSAYTLVQVDKEKSKFAGKKSLQKRKFDQILFLSSTEDQKSERLRNYFFELLPDDWEFVESYNLDKKLTGYLWEKEQR